jgi:polyferredoxin
LSIFSGFFAAWRVPLAGSSFALAAGFPLILLLSAFAPNAWCQKLCPLGAAQDLAARLRRAAARQGTPAPDIKPSGSI